MSQPKRLPPRLNIDPSKVRPVPQDALDRFEKAMQEGVIKPMQARQRERYRRAVAFWRGLAGEAL